MKSIYTRRGLTTLADYRRPESMKEKLPRHSRDLLKRAKAALAEEPELSLREQTRPPGYGQQRADTRPEGYRDNLQRDDVSPPKSEFLGFVDGVVSFDAVEALAICGEQTKHLVK